MSELAIHMKRLIIFLLLHSHWVFFIYVIDKKNAIEKKRNEAKKESDASPLTNENWEWRRIRLLMSYTNSFASDFSCRLLLSFSALPCCVSIAVKSFLEKQHSCRPWTIFGRMKTINRCKNPSVFLNALSVSFLVLWNARPIADKKKGLTLNFYVTLILHKS